MDAKLYSNYQGNFDTESDLEDIKQTLHRGNWSYLRRHPELRAIMRVFLHELINKQPESIYEFSAALFNSNNSPLLVTKINQQLKRVNEQMKNSRWTRHDGEMFFSEMDATHSLLSSASIGTVVNSVLLALFLVLFYIFDAKIFGVSA